MNARATHVISVPLLLICLIIGMAPATAQEAPGLTGHSIDGYRGIWFELNQKYPHGDKYSGGLGTYTAKHHPLAIYRPEVDKTFFVYGGTTQHGERHLLCMIGVYDHQIEMVSRPVVVHDKLTVDDPHDNPSLQIDPDGYLHVFVSGRGRSRPGFLYRSLHPYDISAFEQLFEWEMTYPQPWYMPGRGFMLQFTKYTGIRELYWKTSTPDGLHWTEDQKLAGIRETDDQRAGHYQISKPWQGKMGTFFNWHPDGNVDRRTSVYYLESHDFGQTWQTVGGQVMETPLTRLANDALVHDYYREGCNVYVKDLLYDEAGRPVLLYLTSGGHEPGPDNDPRDWHCRWWDGRRWREQIITQSDHNYDMGSLHRVGRKWFAVAPTLTGPQPYGTGGEIAIWSTPKLGKKWTMTHTLTRGSDYNHGYVRASVAGKAPFNFFWADGHAHSISPSRLYFGDWNGHVYLLPDQMDGSWATPQRIGPR